LAILVFSSFTTISKNSIFKSNSDSEILSNYIESNGIFKSISENTLIRANEVKKNIENLKYHIIDIRSESWFEYGHIKNANNVKPADLLSYFETKISPNNFEKIVVICYSGQSASYYTSLLRIAGYNNVYSMNWGMSSWRVDFAENSWLKNIKNTFASKLETNENAAQSTSQFPTLHTNKTNPKEILRERLLKAFSTPYREHIIKSTDVFENPNNYFTISYTNLENYKNGHIPGAFNYTPSNSFTIATNLNTLPINKKIAIYCETGQRAAKMVAYLSLLGYDTGNIAYGENSFMNKILKEKNWNAFSKKEIHMYPVIE
jgi:rhodanese-related sulfurtransferase